MRFHAQGTVWFVLFPILGGQVWIKNLQRCSVHDVIGLSYHLGFYFARKDSVGRKVKPTFKVKPRSTLFLHDSIRLRLTS